jgi:anti-anti-sigma factor
VRQQRIASVGTKEFQATADVAGDGILVKMSGNAEIRAVAELEALVPQVHAEAQQRGCAEVVVDLTDLEFMNSSCFRSFINWLDWIRDLDEAARYKIRFLADPEGDWQRASLRALSFFAVGTVIIENFDL